MTNSTAHAPTPSLAAIMQQLALARDDQAEKLLLLFQQALERGADPNLVSKKGTTALSVLDDVDRQADWPYLRTAILSLMSHGANGWHEGPVGQQRNTALAYLANGVVVEDGRLANVWGRLASALVEGILEQEKRGVFTNNPRGNNPLHVVCEHGIELVPYLFQENLFRQEWIAQTNLAGDTPLHCLWKKREALTDLVRFDGMDRTIDALWQATADLVERGADMGQANADGQTPLNVIKQMLKKGLRQRGYVWPVVETMIQAAELDVAAPRTGKRATAPRL